VSQAPPADASRPALSGWGRPAWSLLVKPFDHFGAWMLGCWEFIYTLEIVSYFSSGVNRDDWGLDAWMLGIHLHSDLFVFLFVWFVCLFG